jgi:hypothetical protein
LDRLKSSHLDPLLHGTHELSHVPGAQLYFVFAPVAALVVESKAERALSRSAVLARIANQLDPDLLRHHSS